MSEQQPKNPREVVYNSLRRALGEIPGPFSDHQASWRKVANAARRAANFAERLAGMTGEEPEEE